MSALCPSDTDLRKWVGEEGEVKGEGEGGGGEGGGGKGEGEEGEGERGGRDKDEEEEDDPLTESTAEDEVGKLLRSTLQELETALQESRKLLAERDEELTQIKSELEHYKVQVAREIANKTKIAKSLDESLSHVREMEEITQQWQLEVKEGRQEKERLQAQLTREHSRYKELESQLEQTCRSKDHEITQLSSQLLESREKLKSHNRDSEGSEGIDSMTFHFLKQAVFHFLTDYHAEDHLRSISSILRFSPQERKAVYSKYADQKK